MDVELSRSEAALSDEEAALRTEIAKLEAVGAQLGERLASAKQLVAQASAAGVTDGALAGRLETVHVPALNASAAFAKASQARAAAIQARRDAHAQVKQQLTALKGQLTKLAQQFLADEQAAQQLLAKAQAQQKARAVAPPPPPPPAPPAMRPAASASAPTVTSRPKPEGKPFDGRESQRLQQRVRMQAAVDFGSDNNFFNGFSANISDGGLFVATVNLLKIGTQIDLNFSLPSGEKIQAQGVVRWVREVSDKHPDAFPGIGVQFTKLDDAAQAAIERFVSSREPMFYVEE